MAEMTRGAQRLRKLTTAPAIRQADLARKVGVTPQAVSNWVHGLSRPGRDLAVKVEAHTGIPVADWSAPANDAEENNPAPTPPATAA
jgi:transcriptional regulator with XRE-family HTH domain